MLHKTRTQGGGLADCTAEENLEIMTKAMSNKDLHLKAARAYNRTGTTNALDGTDDDMIAGDAKTFWDELDMSRLIQKEVAEVKRQWDEKEIKWDLKAVMSFITPYPKRGEMDEWRPGMEDEATADPDGVPYLPSADDEPAEDEDAQCILGGLG